MNNIEINDKLEADIENKYIKFKEDVKFTTEEAIYILKRKDFCDEIENIAIENLIQENKELKEKVNVLNQEKEYLNTIIDSDNDNYIAKSKVKEKIEEKIKEGNYRTIDNPSGRIHFQKEITDYQIEILKELLEGE